MNNSPPNAQARCVPNIGGGGGGENKTCQKYHLRQRRTVKTWIQNAQNANTNTNRKRLEDTHNRSKNAQQITRGWQKWNGPIQMHENRAKRMPGETAKLLTHKYMSAGALKETT